MKKHIPIEMECGFYKIHKDINTDLCCIPNTLPDDPAQFYSAFPVHVSCAHHQDLQMDHPVSKMVFLAKKQHPQVPILMHSMIQSIVPALKLPTSRAAPFSSM